MPPDSSNTSRGQDQAQAASFFEEVAAVAMRALASGENETRDYQVAGLRLRTRFAASKLAHALGPALEHCRVLSSDDAADPDLTIDLFDSATTGLRLPQRPWAESAYLPRMEVAGFQHGRFRAAVSAVGGSVSLLDLETNRAFYWIENAASVPHYESGAPLLAIAHWWLSEHGLQLVHAGAVGNSNGAALLVGKGGSGKSTSAMACIGSKLGYLGDDYCLLEPGPPAGVHSLYATGKLHGDNEANVDFLERTHFNRGSAEKRVFTLAETMPETLLRQAPLRVILLPQWNRNRRDCLASPISAAAALAAAAPSTVLQLPGAGRKTFASLGAVLRRVPAYRLETGTDLAAIPEAIAEILERHT